jgi:site-specific DNA recombinase
MRLEIPKNCKIADSTINNANNYAAIYCRESNPNKKGALENQESSNERYAQANGFIIYDIYKEFTSAANNYYYERPEFMRLLEDAKKGCFKKIIITKRDRLARRYDDFILIRNLCKQLQIELIYCNDIKLDNTESYAANFIENMMMAIAQIEPSNIKNRIRDGKNAKKLEGIYDSPASFGYIKKDNYIKYQYIKDGIKAYLVHDIFKIYLSSDEIRCAKDVVNYLSSDYVRNKYRRENRNKYLAIIEEFVNESFVREVLSKPIYAGIQTESLDYKYQMFIMTYNGIPTNIDLEHFLDCKNVCRIISPQTWSDAVNKWLKYNTQTKIRNVQKKHEEQTFRTSLYCGKCEKEIKLTKNTISCGTGDCISFSKENFLKGLIKALIYSIKILGGIDYAVKNAASNLKKEKYSLECNLKKEIFRQGDLVNKYIEGNNDNNTIEKIKDFNRSQLEIKEKISFLQEKIEFLEGRFSKIIFPLLETEYFHIVMDDILDSQLKIIEVFVRNNITELKVNGKSIRVRKD